MSVLEPLKKEKASQEALDVLDFTQKAMGRVSNVLATAAHSPNTLKAVLEYTTKLRNGELTPKECEAAALAIAHENGCTYCEAAHTKFAERLGFNLEETIALRTGTHKDPKLHALARLAREIVATNGHPDKSFVEAFYAAGYSQNALVALIGIVSMNIFYNYLNHIATIPLDFPQAPPIQ